MIAAYSDVRVVYILRDRDLQLYQLDLYHPSYVKRSMHLDVSFFD